MFKEETMRKSKYLLGSIFICLMALGFLFPAKATMASDGKGTWENLSWYFADDTDTLTISGEGFMPEISGGKVPWKSYSSKIKTVKIQKGVTSISGNVFATSLINYDSMTTVILPEGLETIGKYAFWGSKIQKINLPSTLTTIETAAFLKCEKLTSISIPGSVKTIPADAFGYCDQLTSVKLGDGINVIGKKAFMAVPIKSLTLPDSVTNISSDAFHGCSELTSLSIPSSVTYVGNEAFAFCSKLQWIDYKATTALTDGVFSDCSNLEVVKLAEGVPSIDEDAFENNYKLAAIYIPESVKTIDEDAFYRSYAKEIELKIYCIPSSAADTFAWSKNGITPVDVSTSAGKAQWDKIWQEVRAAVITNSNAIIKLSTTSYTYNGKVRTPSVSVKYAGKTLTKGTDYTVTYGKGRKLVGKYSVKLTFTGNYKGTVTKYFTIKPTSTYITSLSKAKKSFTVRWSKKTTQVTGYQVRYSRKSSFSSYSTKTITSYKTNYKKVTGLRAKTKYYVKVRTYKTVNGTRYYSGWSKVKTVTTK